jgi:predicted AlkP superfamily pyrophosphatase or phosphodiesterase
VLALLLLSCAQTPPADYVVFISVDGLRSDALLVEGAAPLPNFQRLMRGAGTLNARTDPVSTVTLPNHVGMLSGRVASGKDGHGWFTNIDPTPEETLLMRKGTSVAGIYHMTSAAGIADAMFASKPKFELFRQSWNTDDATLIDVMNVEIDPAVQMQQVIKMLDRDLYPRCFVFVHFRGPDDAGHASGWDLTPNSPYMLALANTDATLGVLFAHLDAHPLLKERTALVMTSDHGGGIPQANHTGNGLLWVNYVVPFFIWTAAMHEPQDLYVLNRGQYIDPGIDMPTSIHIGPQPVRNSDAANLCLKLLGLPPVPESTINLQQQLRWTAPSPTPPLDAHEL